jgi:hypothetical protein
MQVRRQALRVPAGQRGEEPGQDAQPGTGSR